MLLSLLLRLSLDIFSMNQVENVSDSLHLLLTRRPPGAPEPSRPDRPESNSRRAR